MLCVVVVVDFVSLQYVVVDFVSLRYVVVVFNDFSVLSMLLMSFIELFFPLFLVHFTHQIAKTLNNK